MTQQRTPREALEAAIDKAGGRAELAAAVGGKTQHQHVQYWLKNGTPASRAPSIERATGIRCEELCPGIDWAVLREQAAPADAAEA